jgi:hypothetical protein
VKEQGHAEVGWGIFLERAAMAHLPD